MLILLIIVLLLFGGAGGYYGYHRWGAAEGLGGIFLAVLALFLFLDSRMLFHVAQLAR